MKNIKSLYIVIICILSGMHLYAQSTVNEVSNRLTGDWKLVNISGGIAGINVSYTDGYILHFEAIEGTDSITLSGTSNEAETVAGKYQICYTKSMICNDNTWMLASSDLLRKMIAFQNDTLYLTEDAYDGFCYTYVKLKTKTQAENPVDILLSEKNNSLHFSGTEIINKVNVLDVNGKQIISQENIAQNETYLDISRLKKGIYIVEIFTDKKHVLKKIIKK